MKDHPDTDDDEYRSLEPDEILGCVTADMGDTERMDVNWEHESWWVTCLDTGAQWSVHLCTGPEAMTFEQVSEGDDGQ